MSESPNSQPIFCEEVFDENSVPSEEEVIEYATKIGIDPKSEPHLLPIAINGLMQPLPPEWKPCFDPDCQKYYYFNTETKKCQWEHPLDSYYRQVVKRGRSEGYSSAGDDGSKTTAQEDLKSFEEASDILSSKSVDCKLDPGEEKGPTVMNERGPLLKGSQPLLLRRKQLQSGQDPLHVAKLINSTLRQSLPKEDVLQRSMYSDMGLPGPMPALRRSQTSDLITPHAPPIKGILRESSFSGSVSSARPVSVRFNPLQRDGGSSGHEGEDEKKRSVRFADFERPSLDIRFNHSQSDETYSDVDEDDSSSESLDQEQGIKEIKLEPKPKILSPLQNLSPSNDLPKTRKFTVTPVKEGGAGFQASELRGLFRSDSVGPLDTDSDFSLDGGRKEEEPLTGVSKEGVLEEMAAKLANPVQQPSSPPSESDSPVKLSGSEGLKRVPAVHDLKALQSEEQVSLLPQTLPPEEGNTSSIRLSLDKLEEELAQKQKEKLDHWQKKLDEELKEKIKELESLQTSNIALLKESLMKNEDFEKNKLKEEFEENIRKIKESLDAEYTMREKELRDAHKQELDKFYSELQKERENEMERLKEEHKEVVDKWKEEQDNMLKEEKIRLDATFFENLQRIKADLKEEMDKIKAQSEEQIKELMRENEKKIADLQSKFEDTSKEMLMKHQNEIKEMEENHRVRLDEVRREKESERLRAEGEWEDRLTATSLSQKAHLESVEREHEAKLARLKADWEREEAEARRRRTALDQNPPPVDYEKLRCEKRLLEDKYRTLKEKYIQLKKDLKIAVEKKLQAKIRRKQGEQMEKEISGPERPSNLSKELHQSSTLMTPKITVGEVSPRDITDPSSDEQFTLSYSHHEKSHNNRKKKSHRDRTPTSRLEEEEEISGDIYLRHPLSSLGLSRSAEVEFYRQRLPAEEAPVRVIRRSFEEPRSDRRDSGENNNKLLIHQEKELNDLEDSIQRTRALFGEKMIRLRLLGQTLSRLADDNSSSPPSAGADMSPNAVIQNLDSINAEIKEIWNQLNKNQAAISGAASPNKDVEKTEDKSVRSLRSSSHHHRASKKADIEARLQGLRDWLQKPPPPDWTQLTL